MDEYLSLDKGEHIPLSLTWHLLTCKKCRTNVRLLSKAEKLAARPLSIESPVSDEKISAIIKDAAPGWDEKYARPVSMTKWIVCGLLTLCFMLSFRLVAKIAGGLAVQEAYYLVFAGVVTAYSAIFVGTNLDFFIKKMEGKI